MVPFENVVHRPSVLKQQNKKHNKLGHRTKGQLAALNKGRVSVVNISKACKAALSKEQRRNQAKQRQSHKRKEAINRKRLLGTETTPPFLITILSLYDDINLKVFMEDLETIDGITVSKSQTGNVHLSYNRLKQRFSFVLPNQNDLYAILDATKVSDTVLLLWKHGESLTDEKNNILSCLKYQGMPSVIHSVISEDAVSQKKKVRLEKEIKFTIQSHFPENTKLYSFKKFQDTLLFFRQIGSQKRKDISFRDRRMHFISEEIRFIGQGSSGVMEVEGYIRGKPITANDLIHIPGWGEFQINQIYLLSDPHPLESCGKNKMECQREPELVSVSDPTQQQTLASTRDSLDDEMNRSQELEDEEEDSESLLGNVVPKAPKRIPKGVSDYQAAWILSDDEEDYSEDDSEGDEEDFIAPKSINEDESLFDGSDHEDDNETMTMTDAGDDYDQDYDYDDEMEEIRKIKAAKDDVVFPDEIDTPMDISARERFKKYRGLESFRTSPWVQNENFPDEYRKIFQFKDFKHVKKSVLKEKKDGIQAGNYVRICLDDVPRHLYEEAKSKCAPVVLFSLLKNEQKMSVVNVVLKSHSTNHNFSIRAKEKLIFHMGIRRFANNPIFSEHTNGDKHRFFRFFHPGQTVVATMYAPITYPPCPVSVFQRRLNGTQILVATGFVYSVDPNRIICKRVVLSGHPFKVNKKSAVVRYMFFNPLDVNWFKPIELRTKWGKKGHIVEPLGTHGHMKCKFNGQLNSQDSVLLKLYKRIFPKWYYDPYVENPTKEPAISRQPSSVISSRKSSEMPSKKRKKVSFV